MSLMLAAMLGVKAHVLTPDTVNAFRAEAQARVALIDHLLGAMAHHDHRAFAALGGDKIAFTADPDMVFTAVVSPRAPRLTIDSFAALSACKAGRPESLSANSYSVSWQCPNAVDDISYSFKFAGRNLIAVQAVRHPPTIKI